MIQRFVHVAISRSGYPHYPKMIKSEIWLISALDQSRVRDMQYNIVANVTHINNCEAHYDLRKRRSPWKMFISPDRRRGGRVFVIFFDDAQYNDRPKFYSKFLELWVDSEDRFWK